MKIAFVISNLGAGGSERVVSLMANYWSERGYQIIIIILDGLLENVFYPLDEKIQIYTLNLAKESNGWMQGLAFNIYRLWKLRALLKRINPDRLISFIDKTNVMVLLAALGYGFSIIVSERTNPFINKIGWSWTVLKKLVYPLSDTIVVQTQSAYDRTSSRLQPKTKIIPNPLNPIASPSKLLQTDSQGRNKIIAMGRLVQVKGFDILIKAFSTLALRYPEWDLIILGEGSERKNLEQLREMLGLDERVLLPGTVKEVHVELSQAQLFVLSSHYEGFPNALCEAMAVGLPVIASRCDFGPSEIIRDGLDGILIPTGDVNALAEKLEELIQQPELRKTLGENARANIMRFSITRVMDIWENVLQESV